MYESKKVIGNNFKTGRKAEDVAKAIKNYEKFPHQIDYHFIPPVKIKFGKRLKKHQRVALVNHYKTILETHNASRISRAIYHDFKISVKRQTISQDIKQINQDDFNTYRIVERNNARKVLKVIETSKKYTEITEEKINDLKAFIKVSNRYQDIMKTQHGRILDGIL